MWPMREGGPHATSPHLPDCDFFAWLITSPVGFACGYLQTTSSLELTSQSL